MSRSLEFISAFFKVQQVINTRGGLKLAPPPVQIGLNMAINRWKAITGHLFDTSRPNSLTRVDDVAAKEYEELEYEKYENL